MADFGVCKTCGASELVCGCVRPNIIGAKVIRKTEYELRAKDKKDGIEKEIILDKLDQKMQKALMALLMDGENPEDWIVHVKERYVERQVTSYFLEHVKIGLCIPIELADSSGGKLPDEVKDCVGLDKGCVACQGWSKGVVWN